MPDVHFTIIWDQPQNVGPLSYTCGFCGDKVGGFQGWFGRVQGNVRNGQGRIYVCTTCSNPSFFLVGAEAGSNQVNVLMQSPMPPYGESVKHVSPDVGVAYVEARACVSAKAYSAAVIMCRKLLMHIAVDKANAPAGGTFISYLDALENGGFIAPPNRPWIDKIRALGNDANHDLAAMTKEQAEMAVDFASMLLKTLYEYPVRAV